MGAASLQILLIFLFSDSQLLSHVTLDTILFIIYLGAMWAGVVYFLYMLLISETGPVFTSLTNDLGPTFGVLVGVIFANENVALNTWIALALILIAVALN
ncbi:EamA family transporter [Agarivorans sp. QJM3NY_29]|uniref:EamA family transporter n=1 Tax=unclassified Agarivorans TaxID=2636026 RepID=UPI003D7D0684